MSEISKLEPSRLWQIFDEICEIPHPSYHEDEIRKFVADFGKKLGLETIIDEALNVIIRKPATTGNEKKPGIILQAHLDMVPQKNNDSTHDFEKDPILPRIIDGKVYATDTTLGADNGIGVAAMMAVLEDKNIEHPALECLFTATEEAGMDGANGLKPGVLQGKYLINLDSEDEGEIFVGCAGGIDANIEFDAEMAAAPAEHIAFKLNVTGLKGGHSGDDIKHGRGNANKILFSTYKFAAEKFELEISDVQSGGLRNAIPREGDLFLTVKNSDVEAFKAFVAEKEKEYTANFHNIEEGIKLTLTETEMPTQVFAPAFKTRLVNSVVACPNEVYRMCYDVENVVETSSNLSSVKLVEAKVEMKCLLRSSVDTRRHEMEQMIKANFELAGARIEFTGAYSGWEPKMDSYLLETVVKTYEERFKVKPEIKIIHAGLECGIIGAKYPEMEMTSFGPTIRNPHSPTEYVDIETVQKFWHHLKDSLIAL